MPERWGCCAVDRYRTRRLVRGASGITYARIEEPSSGSSTVNVDLQGRAQRITAIAARFMSETYETFHHCGLRHAPGTGALKGLLWPAAENHTLKFQSATPRETATSASHTARPACLSFVDAAQTPDNPPTTYITHTSASKLQPHAPRGCSKQPACIPYSKTNPGGVTKNIMAPNPHTERRPIGAM
jgi:hypothetical protein